MTPDIAHFHLEARRIRRCIREHASLEYLHHHLSRRPGDPDCREEWFGARVANRLESRRSAVIRKCLRHIVLCRIVIEYESDGRDDIGVAGGNISVGGDD